MSRVCEIRYVGYGVTNFAAERAFYRDIWGLREVSSDDGMAYFAAQGGEEHHVVRLRSSKVGRIDVIALAAPDRAVVDGLHAKVSASAAKLISAPHDLASPGGGYGFRFFSPDGLTFEISSDVEQGEKRDISRWDGVPVKISHIVLHSPDPGKLTQFFIDVLGFRLSDWLGDLMAFLRCNSAHHRIAVLRGPPCLNHVAYDMQGIDGVMRGISRLKQNKVDIGWGPGRHTAGNNVFSYFVTPSNFVVEYTAELEDVDDDSWEAKVHPPEPTTMDQWGIGVGGPQALPHPVADAGLFQAVAA